MSQHRSAVGGMWEEIGKAQFQFLLDQGMEPSDYLLDVGCGSLRGGIHFIKYLDTGHYFGVEKEADLLKAGQEIEIVQNGLKDKNPTLILSDEFNLGLVPHTVRFDYALALSVFTHLPIDKIEQCLRRVMPRLSGEFYATFWRGPVQSYSGPHKRRKDEIQRAVYPFNDLLKLARRLGCKADDIGDWGHPRNQQMLRIYR